MREGFLPQVTMRISRLGQGDPAPSPSPAPSPAPSSGDGAGLDRTFVSHDAGQSWTYETAFYAGFNNYCDPATPVGTVCASGPTFDQTHGDPLQLVYSLNVCTSKDDYDFDSCQTQTYRMDGWPNGPLEPVKLSP